MTESMETDYSDRHRAASPALTDISELTTLSRSPSPIPEYNAYASPKNCQAISSASDGHEQGGFGALDRIPMELRQDIYSLAFNIDEPVLVKECCHPGTTKRMLELCPKHGAKAKSGAGRFNILQVSKVIRTEAMWVVFDKTPLLLNTEGSINKYYTTLPRPRTLRKVIGYRKPTTCKSAIWKTANQFRTIKIDLSEDLLQYGNPYAFIDRLVCIVTLLCKEQDKDQVASKSVHLNLGSFFQQMIPFNEKSQLDSRYGEYLDWLFFHSDTHEPDHDKLAKGVVCSLQRLVATIGKHSGREQWKIFVKTEIPAEDEGGAKALFEFQVVCAQHGVEICQIEG